MADPDPGSRRERCQLHPRSRTNSAMVLNMVSSSAHAKELEDDDVDGGDDEEESSPTGGQPLAKAVGSLALSQGWRLTKKAAIVGAVFTSAPLVIPPYCIFSTISLALSVPFAVYLASVAAAEKVVRFLLPPPADSELALMVESEAQEDDFEEAMDRSAAATDDDVEMEREKKAEWKPREEGEEAPTANSSSLAEAADSAALSSEYTTSVAEGTTEAKVDVDGRVTTDMAMRQPPNQRIYSSSKEKIWEDICALRTITGYTAMLHSSAVEELRALYSFTGVEPPLSLKDSSDTIQIDEKVQFLKLVVGVE